MNECDVGEDSEEEEFRQSEGVIDLEDYLEDLKEQDEEWAKKHSIQCLWNTKNRTLNCWRLHIPPSSTNEIFLMSQFLNNLPGIKFFTHKGDGKHCLFGFQSWV